MLASVFCNAVDFLITDDTGIHRRAKRLNCSDRVLSVADAWLMLESFRPEEIKPRPAVEPVFCHQLDSAEPIFDSLRADYIDFDRWLTKAQREHRRGFIIRHENTTIASVAIPKKNMRRL